MTTKDEINLAKLKGLPDRFLRCAEAYLCDKLSPEEIAAEQGISPRTVYHRLRLVERKTGERLAYRTKRGRPRSAA